MRVQREYKANVSELWEVDEAAVDTGDGETFEAALVKFGTMLERDVEHAEYDSLIIVLED